MSELARRTVIAGAGAGLLGLATEAKAESAKPDIQASEYWTQKGDVKLYIYRKHAAAKAGEKQPVVFLVHGSSISSTVFEKKVKRMPPRNSYSLRIW